MSAIQDVLRANYNLSAVQIELIEKIANQFSSEFALTVKQNSNLVSEEWARYFANFLMIQHLVTDEPFTKDKFEYAFVACFKLTGHNADKETNRTNRGHDVTVDGVRYSLKTQANKGISEDKIHISKFMELGSGDWDYEKLRDQFFTHLNHYERILTLRCLSCSDNTFKYELVEISKELLLKAKGGVIEAALNSRQRPIPGYCRVYENNNLIFELYFDGGTERKLQIKNILKSNCIVHAEWNFHAETIW